MFNFSDRMLEQFVAKASTDELHQKLNAMAAAMGDAAFGKHVAREIVQRTQPQKAVPEIYNHYRRLVCDGIEFFLSRVSRHRLVELVVNQLKMDPAASPEERLLELAKRFPTLHKLGQIIARNRHIDPAVKQWLVHLENGRYGTPRKGLLEAIQRELEQTGLGDRVHIRPTILAEASVGAVIPFHWRSSFSEMPIQGVFKVLKPNIPGQLDEELTILQEVAAFFEANRERYPLRDFKFLDVFQDVRQMLIQEIDLAAEQTHLNEAARFYCDMADIRVPQLLPPGTDAMTAMAYLEGPKLTDAELSPEQRRHCAAILFEALICKPLFAYSESALFHGDPHAGNILAVFEPASDAPCIGLLDWSLAGRLAKTDRLKTVRLIQAIFKADLSAIRRCVQSLANGAGHETAMPPRRLRKIILGVMHSRQYERLPLIQKAFHLLEQLSHEGLVFPAELMLFRKAIFTLEGVLNDLWPAFDMDSAAIQYLTALLIQEFPLRLGNLLFPTADRPENYPSLISNWELQTLMVQPFAAALKSSADALISASMQWGAIFGMPLCPAPASNGDTPRKRNMAPNRFLN